MKRRRTARGPRSRNRYELRAPAHRRPTVHPNPAGLTDKPCGGVMCVRSGPGEPESGAQ